MKKRSKILFVITKSNFGGAQRYVFDLARSLPIEEFDIAVAFGGEGILKKKLESIGVRIIAIDGLERDINILGELRVSARLLRLYKDERPDIVHLNSSKIGGLGALCGRMARIPRIIFTAHGWAFNEERAWWQKKLITFLHWLTILLSHATIAVSEKVKLEVSSLPFVSKKIEVIHNGVDIAGAFSQEEARDLLRRHNKYISPIPDNAVWVGTISELHKTKGLTYAIRAFEVLLAEGHNAFFIIIGEGEERRWLMELLKKKNLEDRVILYGFLDVAAQYLKAFDIFTLTSVSEALSYTILEAGLSNRAVVASKVGGIPEIVTHEETGLLVPPRNFRAIARALSFLIEHKEKREALGMKLNERVRKDFSLREMLEKTVALYKN